MRSKAAQYPFEPGTILPWNPGLVHKAELTFQYHFRKRQSPRPNSVRLTYLGNERPRSLADEDMPLMFVTHNNLRLLRAFLRHYRGMGVTRFICVDDQSHDGTRELLLEQDDVDCFESDVRFRDAARGKIWREILFELYGYDRWYINVDSDEFLIYESIETEPVQEYARRLFDRDIRRLPAPMIDLYPITGLDDAVYDGSDDRMPWEVATHFDGDGYQIRLQSKGLNVYGGARSRVFGEKAEMMKYPLIYWDEDCSLGRSIHRPLPGLYNFAPVVGCLMHFKIFSDFRQTTEMAIENSQHILGADFYRNIQEQLDIRGTVPFKDNCSVKYRGPQDLIERGFVLPLAS